MRTTARRRWIGSWLFGLALAAAVVVFATHWSEERDFGRLMLSSRPLWLAVAAVLQAGTYLAQGAVWTVVLRRTRSRVGVWALYRLSVAKLFWDQAIPSAGISGTVLIMRGLQRRGVERGPVMACVVVQTVTNFTSFIVALLVALAFVADLGRERALVWGASAVFIAVAVGITALLLSLSNGNRSRIPAVLRRVRGLKMLLDALAKAPPELTHSIPVLVEATALNFAIHALDAATLWALLKAVGTTASPTHVFAAFMLSTLARTVGVLPGGMGTFEAASIGTLRLARVSTPASVAATLLFRGFSFFVPLIPGLVLSRKELRRGQKGTGYFFDGDLKK